MRDEVAERFQPLLALAKSKNDRVDLLLPDNLVLAARFSNAQPLAYEFFLRSLSAWDVLSRYKTLVTRQSAASKRKKDEEEAREAATARLVKAEKAGQPVITEGHPTGIARDFMAQVRPHLLVVNGEWLDHNTNFYATFERETIRADLQQWLDSAVNAETGNKVLVNKSVLDNVMDALSSMAHRPHASTKPPMWLEPGEDDPDPKTLIACSNGLLNINNPYEPLRPNTPRLFTRNGLPYEFEDPFYHIPPYEFLKFLEDIWPEAEGGRANKDRLQEWFGYLLTFSDKYQKILLMMGQPRAGKGVILRILRALLGEVNVQSTTFTELSGTHGTAGLVGKNVMFLPDAVITKDSGRAFGTLLALSGGDAVGVNPKFRRQTSEELGMRVVIATNEAPIFPDRAGALSDRLDPLLFSKTFAANPDVGLSGRIIANELSGVVHWALEGMRRLEARGSMPLTPSGAKIIAGLRRQLGPITTFVKDWCEVEKGAEVSKADMWGAYSLYCDQHDIPNGNTRESFGREMVRVATGFDKVDTRHATVEGRRVWMYTGVRLTEDAAVRYAESHEEDF